MTKHQPVTILRRLFAMLYDLLLVSALLFIASALLLLISRGHTAVNPLKVIWFLGVAFAYYGYSWVNGGRTLGMKAWKMRLLNINGAPVSWPQALLRFLLALPSVLLVFGFVYMLFNQDKQTLYDQITDTVIVDERNDG